MLIVCAGSIPATRANPAFEYFVVSQLAIAAFLNLKYSTQVIDLESIRLNTELELVPLNNDLLGDAEAIYRESFGGTLQHYKNDHNYSVQLLLYNRTVIGVMVYHDGNDISRYRYVDRLCIAAQYRNQQYGTQLFHCFEQLTYQNDIFDITLYPAPRAVPFYKRLGFQWKKGLFCKKITACPSSPIHVINS